MLKLPLSGLNSKRMSVSAHMKHVFGLIQAYSVKLELHRLISVTGVRRISALIAAASFPACGHQIVSTAITDFKAK